MRQKIKRAFTSFLPISEERSGNCNNCGDCCKLPNVCPFLIEKPDGESRCAIYVLRPLSCRKYPRTEAEFITTENCGFHFEKKEERTEEQEEVIWGEVARE